MARPKINVIEITSYIHHDAEYDEEGREIKPAWDEPVYEAVTREMNDTEYAEYQQQQAEEAERQRTTPPTDEERISAMEGVILELLGGSL